MLVDFHSTFSFDVPLTPAAPKDNPEDVRPASLYVANCSIVSGCFSSLSYQRAHSFRVSFTPYFVTFVMSDTPLAL
jgi:hypothetical protein